jgi:alkyl hydroperoxide reductase subunit F
LDCRPDGFSAEIDTVYCYIENISLIYIQRGTNFVEKTKIMLDSALKEQLQSVFSGLEAAYVLDITVPAQHESRNELLELLDEVAASSAKIACQVKEGDSLEFSLLKNGENTGIKFRGVPNGHEFTSLLLAILNSDGKGKNIPDEATCNRVKALKGDIHLTTYVSLTCTNCPDVVQSLNLMALQNSRIRHEMVDGALFQEEADALKIQAVPSVFADGELLHVGKAGFGELLDKLEAHYGVDASKAEISVKNYDVIVIGGGPSGSSAAIYSARKGLKVALLAERIGGQVKETVGIENLISVPYTTGETLAADLKKHLQNYPVDLLEYRRVEKIENKGKEKRVWVAGGEQFVAPAVIIATGAGWRKLNVPGETEYIGRGVAFCPHCDGPFYKGKHVAVVGGGNSGIEAAIDLAGICSKVTVFEFLDELKADKVLQEKAKSLPNVEIFVASQTLEVIGNGEKVTGIRVKNRQTEEERIVELDGIFVQIGLTANSSVFKEIVQTNRFGEIEIDTHCRTNQLGIYASGDVTTVPFKQIIISMGEGAKAALSAFEDRIRGTI